MGSNRNVFAVNQLLQSFRKLHCSHVKGFSYEGSGKTMGIILNCETGPRFLINNYSSIGFVLNNNSAIIGPIAIFPKTVLCWNIKSGKDIDGKTLSLFLTVDPTPDILILGLETTNYEYKRILDIKNILKDRRITVEILPVHHACGAFNFLCDEGRYVAAALIPPVGIPQNKMFGGSMQRIGKPILGDK
ncbi:NADH dehydrogenase [ubiquinone] 1 alpha subcomplex assembly factor 3 [Megalopta genalis]|uniref:NADH dehydrogenase [ubiquinone] 1 alpha subcomplex assembly factor 3 n=1 Tax=Megalopta genalis TaxID=115081 RepID=UPI003FD0250B